LAGAKTVIADTSRHPLNLALAMDGAAVMGEMPARFIRSLVEGKEWTGVETEQHTAQSGAAIAIAAKRRVGHGGTRFCEDVSRRRKNKNAAP
jgi:hypothetical protein